MGADGCVGSSVRYQQPLPHALELHVTMIRRLPRLGHTCALPSQVHEENLGLWTLPSPEAQPKTLAELTAAIRAFLQVRPSP